MVSIPKSSLGKVIGNRIAKSETRDAVWDGPCDPGPRGGITFSMLSRFLHCRERFRLIVVEGLKPMEKFEGRIEYGQMWHICEEAHAANQDYFEPVKAYATSLARTFPQQVEEIVKWYRVCLTQFPIYVRYWESHPDVLKRKPLLQEEVFHVPYRLPSGRTVYLRGKMDSVDEITEGSSKGIYLQENKTKSDIDQEAVQRQLRFDLQTGIYLTALNGTKNRLGSRAPISGVRYNVIRRPLSGGKNSIRPHQATGKKPAETPDEFYTRLGGLIEAEPEYYFMRWKSEVTMGEVADIQQQCLTPLLEGLCDWWELVLKSPDRNPFKNLRKENRGIHWRYPYGVYNPTLEGYSSEIDEYLATGSETGLRRVDSLFNELA